MKDFSDEIKQEIKDVQIEIVKEIDRICSENGLRYYLAYGTLLGAVRHDGFIPWDDDVDIMMPYEDMVRFGEIFNDKADTKRFFYQSPETDSEYCLTINRVCRNESVILEPTLKDKNVHHGLFVDIYPLFGIKEGFFARISRIFKAMKRALYLYNEPPKHKGFIMTLGAKVFLALKSKKGKRKAYEKYTREFARISFDSSKKVCDLSSDIKMMRAEFQREWFNNGIRHKFEDLNLLIPENADKILSLMYGDYMQLPPPEKRVFHHNYSYIKLPDGKEEKID